MRRVFAFVFLLLLIFAFTSDAIIVMRTRGGGARTYLFNEDFEATPPTPTTNCTLDCTPESNNEYCDQCDSGCYAQAPIKDSDSLYVQGETCYVKYSLGGSYDEIYADFWINFSGTWSGGVYFLDASSVARFWFYLNGGPDADLYTTNQGCSGPNALSTNTDYHIRVYYLEDTDDTDGVMKIWVSTTDQDFDGDTCSGDPDCTECTGKNTGNVDLTQIAFYGVGGGRIFVFDNAQVWEPDGNEE